MSGADGVFTARRGRRLRIGVDARNLLRAAPRGEGQTLLRLYESLCALRDDLDVFLFTDRARDSSRALVCTWPGLRIVVQDVPGYRFDAWCNIALPWLCARYRCDVLHAFSTSGPIWSATPVVLTVHDVIPALFLSEESADRRRFLGGLHNGVRLARSIACPSDSTIQDLRRLFDARPLPPIARVPWGSTIGADVRSRLVERRRRGRSGADRPYLLAFGATDLRKNTLRLIEAFARSEARATGLRLVAVGIDPTGVEAFRRHIDSLGCSGDVCLESYVSDARRDELLGGAMALIYPSVYEGFGLPVLDSMSVGLPVIASGASSIPEVGADAAEYFDPHCPTSMAQAIDRVALRPARACDLSERGLQRAAQFTWTQAAETYLATLETAARIRQPVRHSTAQIQ